MVILCFSDNYSIIPCFGAICFQKFWSCIFTAGIKNFMESEQIWDKSLQNLLGTEFTFCVMVTSWIICLSLSLYSRLSTEPVMGLVLVAPLKPTQKSLSTQTTFTLITTVIYWNPLMQIAIASHQYHKSEKSLYHALYWSYLFCFTDIAVAFIRMKYCWYCTASDK